MNTMETSRSGLVVGGSGCLGGWRSRVLLFFFFFFQSNLGTDLRTGTPSGALHEFQRGHGFDSRTIQVAPVNLVPFGVLNGSTVKTEKTNLIGYEAKALESDWRGRCRRTKKIQFGDIDVK